MKKNLLMAIATLALVFSFSACKKMGSLSQEYFKVEPAVLEAKGGMVNAKISGTFPEKYFKKKAIVVLTPIIKYNGTEERLNPATFQGEGVLGNNKKISYKAGGTYTHRIEFEFKPGMEKAELFLEFEVQMGSKTEKLPAVKVADGINCTYMLAKGEMMKPAFAENEFQRTIVSAQEADINFLVAQANIRSSELNKDEIVALTNKLQEVSNTEGSSITAIEISGYASPEGSLGLNTSLAERREQVAVDYINKQMKKLQSAVEVDSRYTAEDWEGFQQLVSNSSIQDKELILNVLSQFSDPEQREMEIRKLSAAFKALATDILPQLRRSKMKVSFELSGKTDEQLVSGAKTAADSMTVEELLYAGTLVNSADEKVEIYSKAAELYPEDWRTINNLGAAKFLQGNIDEAEQLFSKAIDMNSSAKETNYNWGVVKLTKGEVKIAESFLGKAAGIGDMLDAALGVIYLHKGDYGAATKALNKDKSNNNAIAKLVVKDVASAQAILAEVETPTALTAYLKAIAFARQGDKASALSNLKEAATKDADLKARAAVDIEFAKYREDAEFASIVK
jgi:Flp pilus assembly protein TadD/outer membrane protein OmpA-like peptidoglycan-associated protein